MSELPRVTMTHHLRGLLLDRGGRRRTVNRLLDSAVGAVMAVGAVGIAVAIGCIVAAGTIGFHRPWLILVAIGPPHRQLHLLYLLHLL